MRFMSAYKYLDMICRDMNGIGVSGYIEDMEQAQRGSYSVKGWDYDYQQLKHYRWVRNQLAHEVDVEEDDLCTQEDTEWIENFYNRIIDCSDPLACYATIKKANFTRDKSNMQKEDITTRNVECHENNSSQHHLRWIIFILLIAILFVVWHFYSS